MHRSGTSLLAGSLQKRGVYIGKEGDRDAFNKGNKENLEIVNIHRKVLAGNNSSWDKPPTKANWNEAEKVAATRKIEDHKHYKVWGFKDPRTLLLWEQWVALLQDYQFVASFRSPELVAKSLHSRSRDGFPYEKSLDLWYRYNERLLYVVENYHCPLIHFDGSNTSYKEQLFRLERVLGLRKPFYKREFFSKDLVREKANANFELGQKERDLYKALKAKSLASG